MRSHRREKIARRSSWYISSDVYQFAGRARTGCTFVGNAFVWGATAVRLPLKPRYPSSDPTMMGDAIELLR